MSKSVKPKRNATRVAIKRLAHATGLPFPAYQSQGAAGFDLTAAIDAHHPLQLTPGARTLVPTGLIIELPDGFEAQVRPRSGLAVNHGITVLNSPGTIDADYRGEVRVALINLGGGPFDIRRGDRIAQLIIAPVTIANLVEVEVVTATERGEGGFGSTGTTGPAAEEPRKKPSANSKTVRKKKPPAKTKSKKRTPPKSKPKKKPQA